MESEFLEVNFTTVYMHIEARCMQLTNNPSYVTVWYTQLQAKEDARKRDEEARKEAERQDKYRAAQYREEQRKSRIRQRAEDKDQSLNVLYSTRKKEHDLKKVEQEFQLKLRLDKVRAACCALLCCVCCALLCHVQDCSMGNKKCEHTCVMST